MDGIPPLEEPETSFWAGGLRLYEAREFIRKARTCSAPGLNGISFKLYKNCLTVLEQLVCLLQRARREGYVAQEWCLADGVWIPKEDNSIGVGSFRPISLLNVEGAWIMLKWSGIRWWLQSARRKNSTSYGLTWPTPIDLCRTTASGLHWSSSTSQRRWLTS